MKRWPIDVALAVLVVYGLVGPTLAIVPGAAAMFVLSSRWTVMRRVPLAVYERIDDQGRMCRISVNENGNDDELERHGWVRVS